MVGSVGSTDAAERVRASIEDVSKTMNKAQDEAVGTATKTVKAQAQVQTDAAKMQTAQEVLDQLLNS